MARNLGERLFSVCGPPGYMHCDQGTRFENQLAKELQPMFGSKNTHTAAFRKARKFWVRACPHQSNQACDNWTELLPFVQLAANNTEIYSSRKHRTFIFLIVRLFYHQSMLFSACRQPSNRTPNSIIVTALSKLATSIPDTRWPYVFFPCFFLLIPSIFFTVYSFFSFSLPSRNSDPGSLSSLFPPLSNGTRLRLYREKTSALFFPRQLASN